MPEFEPVDVWVNICGVPHKIIVAEDHFNIDSHFGQIDYIKAEITVNSQLTGKNLDETICHEILHGILVHIGREDLSRDETLVQSLAQGVNQAFYVKAVGK